MIDRALGCVRGSFLFTFLFIIDKLKVASPAGFVAGKASQATQERSP